MIAEDNINHGGDSGAFHAMVKFTNPKV